MSRKILFLLLTVMACSLFVVGCGGSDGSDGAPGAPGASADDILDNEGVIDALGDILNAPALVTSISDAKSAFGNDATVNTALDDVVGAVATDSALQDSFDAIYSTADFADVQDSMNAATPATGESRAAVAALVAKFSALSTTAFNNLKVITDGLDVTKFTAFKKVIASAKKTGYAKVTADVISGKNDYAGSDACITCHTGTVLTEHVASKHVTHSTYIAASSDEACKKCHDPLAEGIWFEAYLETANIPAGGLAAVSCETCHGVASQHVSNPGAYKPQFPEPKPAQCGTCHTGLPESHIPHHPLADQITERYLTSNHADSPRTYAGTDRTCSACHSHEGFLARNTSKRAIAKTVAGIDDNYKNVFESGELEGNSIGCNTCHDDHTFELRSQETKNEAGDAVVFSKQFNLCTSCHQVELDATTYELTDAYLHANSPATSKTVGYHTDSHQERNFVDTHFAGQLSKDVYYADVKDGRDENGFYAAQVSHSGTQYDVLNTELDAYYTAYQAAADNLTIKGYKINPASPTACSSCHDVHSANVMRTSEETVLAYDQNFEERISVGIKAAEGIGETHGDYSKSAFGYAVRDSCMPCHTAEAIITETVGGEAEFEAGVTEGRLGCTTCHDMVNIGDDFKVTNTRTFKEDHAFNFVTEDAEGAEVVLGTVTAAELGKEQICFECHKGRVGLKPGAATATAVYDVAYLHYAPVFSTMFGSKAGTIPTYTGKEYAGRFAHYDGTEFSCADCHDVHTTEAKTAMAGASCNGCHGTGATFATATLKARTQAFSDRLFDTIYALTPDSLYTAVVDGSPRFADGKTVANLQNILTSRGSSSEVGDAALAKAGAIWTTFTYYDGYYGEGHGHGASWAHNSKFARQVMYDAIEALGGNVSDLVRP